MKLQISYNYTDLRAAIEAAEKTEKFANIMHLDTALLFSHGAEAVRVFRSKFPATPILVDVKMIDGVDKIVKLMSSAGATYTTVLYGAKTKVIQKATSAAHATGSKVVMDLIDLDTMGQAACDAEKLGIDYVIFYYPQEADEVYTKLDQWELVRGNTKLPIFVSGKIDREKIEDVLKFKPQGIIVGEAITHAEDPAAEAEYFKKLTI